MSEKLIIKSRLRDYGVDFIDDVEKTIREGHPEETTFFIIDARMLALYETKFPGVLNGDHTLPVEATEQNKTLDYCQTIIRTLVEKNIRKNCTLVAVGGGVIQDVTAFISSVLYRGVDWIFYPTTLLAQADSCIGSKTSINLGEYKNLLGGFYPPRRIYIDTGFLETLPPSEIKSGIGEILHFYLIADSDLTRELADRYDELVASPQGLKKFLLESLTIKKKVIEVDEFDVGVRNLFNYGHTFGHAIESVSDYGVSHGQAVTMGMDIANWISMNLGDLSRRDFESMHAILAKNMPDFALTDALIGSYLEALSRDKKNIGSDLVCILTSGPGAMKKVRTPLDDDLKNTILSYFSSFAR
ncbi:MAG: iron-containing alcohol dehydrogenase [Desulfobacterales bacterium]|nr:iron-containing alcohol dehydrogenase [Desulfobacterales bacterium]